MAYVRECWDLTSLGRERRRQVRDALKLCSFDYTKVGQPIKVVEIEMPVAGRMGYAMSDPPQITMNKMLRPKLWKQMVLEESGHIVDRRCLSDVARQRILEATGAPDWHAYDRDPETGKNRLYAHQGSENFAHHGFMKAFAPELFKDSGWPYPYTRKAVRIVKEVLR